MDFEKLKAFYMVAKTGSITKAAEELGCKVDNVSRRISALENEFRVRLFAHKDKKVLLTLHGQFMFRRAKVILAELESIVHNLQDDKQKQPSGILKISTTNALAALWLPQYVKGFVEEYPDIRVVIVPDDREMDVAVRDTDIMIRPLIPHAPDLIQHYLMTWHVGLYASPQYLAKFGTPQTTDDLDHHRLVTLGVDKILPYKEINWILNVGKNEHETPRDPFLRINSVSGFVYCVLDGLGIAQLSEEIPEVKYKRLIRILPEISGPAVDVFLIYPEFLEGTARVAAFKRYMQKVLDKTID